MIVTPEACVETTAYKDPRGYGYAWIGGKTRRVHRYVLSLKLGRPLAPGMMACHTCDNKSCINPYHLYEGTAFDNMRDAKERNRLNTPRGDRHGSRTKPGTAAKGAKHGTHTRPERRARGERHGSKTKPESTFAIRGANHWTNKNNGAFRHKISGENQYNHKLTADDVATIRRRLQEEPRGIGRKLAAEYAVSFKTISDIKRGKTWKEHLVTDIASEKRIERNVVFSPVGERT